MASERKVRVFAPAKINLFLHVTGRRADGYHLLQTAFRMLDKGDWITLECREDGQIVRQSDLAGVPAEQDLVVRAARLMQQHSGVRLGVNLTVEKHLPMGGGLGGGSSDAASVMLALNRLWDINANRESLQQWGLSLGADVPFFLFGQSALAEGVGEQLQALSLPDAWYVVVEPPVAVPTAEIFSAEDLTRNTEPIIIASFPAGLLRNDLEPVASGRYPAVREALDGLSEAARQAGVVQRGLVKEPRMSGSGACVFLECASEREAAMVIDTLPEGTKAWMSRGLDRHPLHGWAA